MKVTVCELPNDPSALERAWRALAGHVRGESSELVVLPEMPFSRWLASSPEPDAAAWSRAVRAHDEWLDRLVELGAPVVVGTRPVTDGAQRLNEGFVWTPSSFERAHRKAYLPDEPGFWEASWYSAGERSFRAVEVAGVRLGFLICTELWFNQHAREYMAQGVELLVCPRATATYSVEKWLAGGRTAAVVAGAYCLSSNFSGPAEDGTTWAGAGWIVEPEEAEVLGRTTAREPYVTLELDLDVARAAKSTYPRYVEG